MSIKFKLIHDKSKLPTRKIGHFGFDVFSIEGGDIFPGNLSEIRTGLVLADTPVDYDTGNLIALSVNNTRNISRKGVINISCVIDPYFREEIKILLYNTSKNVFTYGVGDKIATLSCCKTNNSPIVESDIIRPI